jgi:hypothetical protein
MPPSTAQTTIKAEVSFPVSKKGKFTKQYLPETTLATVLDAAMTHFAVAGDAQFTYVLTHGGQRQENLEETLGELAGKAHALEFRLVKVITQG